ncbi:MAG: Phosphoglycolate phosphatase [Deltaproteobacteria bacterium ADurb.Bin510]|jgi:phosphoglycolate phosphatase|nr:MAG: Phosphoglycolate phosphatase [Deltaproteobacteria bacterium ADurb.Bin510]
MSYEAIIFDLDGTLLDTLTDIAAAMNRVLAARGLPAHPARDYRFFVGNGMAELARRALPEDCRDAVTIDSALNAMRGEYARCWAESSKPYPGVRALLEDLTARGLKLGVLSSKPDEFARLMVERLLPGINFDAVVGATCPALIKPDPTNALAMAAGFGVSPAAMLFVGDSAVDIETARRAGMHPVGVTWGFRPRAELIAAGALSLIDRPAELLELLR